MPGYDVEKLRANSESVGEYLASAGGEFTKRYEEYKLDEGPTRELESHVDDVTVVVFSAEWCPDCHRAVPVLGLLSERIGLEVRVLGHLMRDAKNPKERWRIPPFPVEVKEFDVVKIPLIVLLDKGGENLGMVVEKPPEGQTLEEALLDIISKA